MKRSRRAPSAGLVASSTPVPVRRVALKLYRLEGPLPDYTGQVFPGRTVATDFASWSP